MNVIVAQDVSPSGFESAVSVIIDPAELMVINHFGSIVGGSIMNKLRKLLKQNAVPFLKDIFTRFGAQALPALGSLAGDKLNDKGLGSLASVVQAASSSAGAELGKNQSSAPTRKVSDWLADQAVGQASKRMGRGNRVVGEGPRVMGQGNRVMGDGWGQVVKTSLDVANGRHRRGQGNRVVGEGPRVMGQGNRILGESSFSSLRTNRNLA